MNGLLLDTHVWIWYVNGNKELSNTAKKKITAALHHHEVYIAAISLWEISMLEKKKRITFEMSCLEWIKKSLDLTHIQIIPLLPTVAIESVNLPGEFHGDPADQLIVATARIEGLTLVTRDKQILTYSKSHHVAVMQA